MCECYLKSVSGYNEQEIIHAIECGLESLGIVEGFFRRGQKVLLKPNLLSGKPPAKAVTTHPVFVSAVAACLKKYDVELYLGDSPSLSSLSRVLIQSGYRKIVEKHGIKVIDFDKGIDTPSREKRHFPLLYLWEGMNRFDLIINLPKLKTHSMMTMTLGVKNCFGFVPGKQKAAYHLSAGEDKGTFARLMLEIWNTVRPSLTILDGVVAMEGNGPGSGSPRQTNIVAMSRNALAIDSVIGHIVGVRPEIHPIIRVAISEGFSCAQWEKVSILGDSLENLKVTDFKLPHSISLHGFIPLFLARKFKKWWTTRPKINEEKCTRCGNCYDVCPVDTIEITTKGSYRIDSSRCIRCFCCHEVCPFMSIEIVKGIGLKIIDRIRKNEKNSK